jgi:soluble lytic murein transglycosylase-like protein
VVAPPLRLDPTVAARRAGALAAFETLIIEAAARHRLDPALIKAVIRTESNFDHRAVSRKGALGLMQLMPGTAGMYGLADAFEPRGNIDAGSKHLRMLLDRYRGDLHLALAAYNAGEQAVERYGRRIPPFAETRGYVRSVLRYLDTYRRAPTLTAGTPSLTVRR